MLFHKYTWLFYAFCSVFFCANLLADYTVILPENSDKQELLASRELVTFLGKSTGEKVVVRRENEKTTGKKIYIGKTNFAKKAGIVHASFAPEESFVKVYKDSLVITGGNVRGIVYGVLDFLEKELWIMFCDETFTFIPDKKGYVWKKDLFMRHKPSFAYRGIYSYFAKDSRRRQLFMLRNRLNMFNDEGRTSVLNEWNVAKVFGSPKFCHTFYSYTKDLPKEDEDIFSLSKSGKRVRSRNASGPGQICQSNPKTRKFFLKKLEEYIVKDRKKYPANLHPVIYTVDMNDNLNKCECLPCKKIAEKYGAYSGLTLEFTNFLAAGIRKKYPDVSILISAYSFNCEPPKGIKAEKNVIVRLTQLGAEWGNNDNRNTMRALSHPDNKNSLKQLEEWSKIASTLAIWDYWILYDRKSNYPSLNVRSIAENAKIYSRFPVNNIFAECESSDIASFHPLRLYIGAKSMYDASIDTDKEINAFIRVYYGKAAPEMKEWFEFLQKSQDSIKGKIGNIPIFARTELNEKFFTSAEKILGRAVEKAGNDPVMNYRVRRERVSVDVAQLTRQKYLKKLSADKKTIETRLRKDYGIACDPFIVNPGSIPRRLKRMDAFIRSFSVAAPLPEQFKDKQVVADFLYSRIESKNGSKAYFVTDPDAAGNGCIMIRGRARDNKVHFGIYDASKKKHLKIFRIPPVKNDGKYHFYSTGKFNLTEKCFLWADWSWNIQANFSEYYDISGQNNSVEVFVSIKSTGKGPEGVFAVDRVILVRHTK